MNTRCLIGLVEELGLLVVHFPGWHLLSCFEGLCFIFKFFRLFGLVGESIIPPCQNLSMLCSTFIIFSYLSSVVLFGTL